MRAPPPDVLLSRVRAAPGVAAVAEALEPGDPPVHAVGGVVRDALLGRPAATDADLVVEGDVPALARALAERLGGRAAVHERFGTATLAVRGLRADLATARRERYPAPGALPEVEAAPLEEDLRRRDFAVNAMACALGGERPGRFASAPRALEDLGARVLRVLHDGSFRDDPTRLLRLVRYGARLGFVADPWTLARAEEAVRDGALDTVSGDRLGSELRLLLGERRAPAGLRRAAELGVLEPVLWAGAAARLGVAERAAALAPGDARVDLVLLAALAVDADEDAVATRLEALGTPARDRRLVAASGPRAAALGPALAALERAPASELGEELDGVPPEAVVVAAATGGPAAEAAARRWLAEVRHVRLEIGGDDLVGAGVEPGPAVGAALRATLARKRDGELAGREAELRAAVAAARAR